MSSHIPSRKVTISPLLTTEGYSVWQEGAESTAGYPICRHLIVSDGRATLSVSHEACNGNIVDASISLVDAAQIARGMVKRSGGVVILDRAGGVLDRFPQR